MRRIVIFFLKIYKVLISPIIPPSCIFEPTCSIYTMEAVNKYGVIKGLFLGMKRILKCNPMNKGGFDPVP